MQWEEKKKKKLVNGDVRERKGFLFLPRAIGGIVKWWEWAAWEQAYSSGGLEDGPFWYDVKWLPVEK